MFDLIEFQSDPHEESRFYVLFSIYAVGVGAVCSSLDNHAFVDLHTH